MLYCHVLGLNTIKELTKQSIHTKPFCLAVGKEWTLRQSTFKLEDTYTELHFQMKYRKPTWTEKKPLENIFTLFEDTKLRRLLIEGNRCITKYTTLVGPIITITVQYMKFAFIYKYFYQFTFCIRLVKSVNIIHVMAIHILFHWSMVSEVIQSFPLVSELSVKTSVVTYFLQF